MARIYEHSGALHLKQGMNRCDAARKYVGRGGEMLGRLLMARIYEHSGALHLKQGLTSHDSQITIKFVKV